MKLISMTAFVIEKTNKITNEWSEDDQIRLLDEISNYANFLNQPLTLGMFVPCVDNEPFNYSKHGNKKEFEEAREKVVFYGFEVCNRTSNIDCVVCKDDHISLKGKTVEYLINRDITLTPNAIKQLKL